MINHPEFADDLRDDPPAPPMPTQLSAMIAEWDAHRTRRDAIVSAAEGWATARKALDSVMEDIGAWRQRPTKTAMRKMELQCALEVEAQMLLRACAPLPRAALDDDRPTAVEEMRAMQRLNDLLKGE